MSNVVKGVVLSILASCLFGLLYYYPVVLRPLTTVEIFCWRLLMSLPAIALLITVERRWSAVVELFMRVKQKPVFFLALVLNAAMLSVQMILFIWAPLNGRALSTSLGYFILPLVMVVCGRFIYKERFSFFQKIAIGLAVIGVALEIYITNAFSWETATAAIGYPIYFIFRREMKIDGIAGVFSDFLFITIGCLIYMLTQYEMSKIIADFMQFSFYIPMLGIITAIAFAAYFTSCKLLPLGLFGLLGYVEPVLLAIVSVLFLNETISSEHIFSYGLIWLAVCVLVLEGTIYTILSIKRKRINNIRNKV
ncbi:EamA family transporter RarD [Zophobihabitans entericus]|uniref:EamA family transporter RarD n=1 Tax=Zophobihabitans entericus TaxID=1635327 RepID=A0A6G9ICD9_9GAMM|nr:EamA family transporter RarD [Zophobihabitans entericus]QIQ21896.1 EamA family transporter RarD [Zophobihabitans entericus]